jgi:hypothetical protein
MAKRVRTRTPSRISQLTRGASTPHAQALAARLGDLAFLDTSAIDDGDQFPQRLLDGILHSEMHAPDVSELKELWCTRLASRGRVRKRSAVRPS